MVAWLLEIATFATKVALIGALIGFVIGIIASFMQRGSSPEPQIRVRRLDRYYQHLADRVRASRMGAKERKAFSKRRKAEAKSKSQGEAPATPATQTAQGRRPSLYVIDFHGDIQASAVAQLRVLVSTITAIAETGDEVLMRLESGGGLVHSYGLAASQCARLRAAKIPLTICVDKVAASGGYMMACEADRIVAAPYAVLGSIGVAVELPNVHRLLRDKGVDYEEFTAGDHKRTVTVAGEITDEKREKLREHIEATHDLFKDHVRARRPQLDIDAVATGETWYGTHALERGLIDEIGTSDDVVVSYVERADVLLLDFESNSPLPHRLAKPLVEGAARVFERVARGFVRRWTT